MIHFFILLFTYHVVTEGSGSWVYSGQGEWGDSCNDNTGHQSPINLIRPDTTTLYRTPLRVPEVTKDIEMIVAHNTHSTKLEFPIDDENKEQFQFTIPTTDDTKTTALQVHLHWGRSEHLLDLHAFPLEMHLVTGRTGEDGTTKLTVFGRFFEIGNSNPTIEKFIRSREQGEETVSSFDLSSVYPATIRYVNTYSGSLTTPPCTEGVAWVVVEEPLPVSQEQIDRLKVLELAAHGGSLKSNYRFIQKRNDREIKRYDLTGSGSQITVGLSCVVLVIARIFI